MSDQVLCKDCKWWKGDDKFINKCKCETKTSLKGIHWFDGNDAEPKNGYYYSGRDFGCILGEAKDD